MDGSNVEEIEYFEADFDEQLLLLIDDIPYQYSNFSGGDFLSGEVFRKRWVSNACAIDRFSISEDEITGEEPVLLRIDYTQLLFPEDFIAWEPDRLIQRKEHVFILASTVRNEEVCGYGLGPEWGHLEWDSDEDVEVSVTAISLNKQQCESILRIITESHFDEIEEYISQVPEEEVLKSLPEPFMSCYARISKT